MLHLDASFDEDIPLGLVAFGPNSLALAGRAFDMVVLHTFFTDETVERSMRIVREEAERSGRDPSSVRIWSCYATIARRDPGRRCGSRRPSGAWRRTSRGTATCSSRRTAGIPPSSSASAPTTSSSSFPGALDAKADTATLEHVATLLPDEWLEPAATGTPQRCAERVLRQLDLGCDGVIMHGATPAELEPVVAAYRRLRPPERFDRLEANPGRPSTTTGA